MIEQKRINDFLSHLGRAEMLNARSQRLTRDEVVELCRVYLAWIDAPERTAYMYSDPSGYIEGRIVCPINLDGKRVRLVEVKE